MRFHTITTLSFLLLLLPVAAKELDSDESLRAFMIECRSAIRPGDPADFLMSRYRPRKDLWAQWMIFQNAFHVSPTEKQADEMILGRETDFPPTPLVRPEDQ